MTPEEKQAVTDKKRAAAEREAQLAEEDLQAKLNKAQLCFYYLRKGTKAYCLIDNTEVQKQFGRPPLKGFFDIQEFQHAERDFKNIPCVAENEKGQLVETSLITEWLRLKERQDISGCTFLPTPPGVVPAKLVDCEFNTFAGWAVQPEAGDDDAPFWELLISLCNQHEPYIEYVTNWLAHLIQKPEEPPLTAIGAAKEITGVGKNAFVNVLGSLMHKSHFKHVTKLEQVIGKFNSMTGSALLMNLDEVSWGGNAKDHGHMKGFITNPFEVIEFKGMEPFEMNACKRILFTSNDPYYYNFEDDDRRLLPLEPDGSVINKQNTKFWKEFFEKWKNGKMREHLLHRLLHIDISSFVPFVALQELELITGQEMADKSMSSIKRWLKHSLSEKAFEVPGTPYPTSWTASTVPLHILKQSYVFFCDSGSALDRTRKTDVNSHENKALLDKIFGETKSPRVDGQQHRSKVFEWDEAQARFNAIVRIKVDFKPVQETSATQSHPMNVLKMHK